MKVLVFGATGGSGRAVVETLLSAGHEVTAFVRGAGRMQAAPGLAIVEGDALNADDVARAVPGHDAVVISLGTRPGARDWFPGRRGAAPPRVCEIGTRNVIAALPDGARPRIVVVSAYGVGDTRDSAAWYIRLYLRLFMRDLMADKDRQEAALKDTALDFVLVQPVALTDGPARGYYMADPAGHIRKQQVSRRDLADFVLRELSHPRHHRATVALSG